LYKPYKFLAGIPQARITSYDYDLADHVADITYPDRNTVSI